MKHPLDLDPDHPIYYERCGGKVGTDNICQKCLFPTIPHSDGTCNIAIMHGGTEYQRMINRQILEQEILNPTTQHLIFSGGIWFVEDRLS